MSKKENVSNNSPVHNNTQKSAVDRLVEAQHGDDSGVDVTMDGERRKPNKLDRIPTWIKALIVKWWFVGAACFFFLWGLGNYIKSDWDMILVFGLATGAFTDLLTNNMLRLLQKEPGEYDFYVMVMNKKLWSLFVNVFYALIVTMLVVYTYDGLNKLIIELNPTKYTSTDVPVPVGPILYGLFYLVYDMVFIMIKNLIVKLVKNKKH